MPWRSEIVWAARTASADELIAGGICADAADDASRSNKINQGRCNCVAAFDEIRSSQTNIGLRAWKSSLNALKRRTGRVTARLRGLPLDKSEGVVKDEDLLCSAEHRVFRQRLRTETLEISR